MEETVAAVRVPRSAEISGRAPRQISLTYRGARWLNALSEFGQTILAELGSSQ